MAVGKIIGGIAGLGLVGVGYSGLAGQDDSTRDSTGAVVEAGQVGALRIRIGDCFGEIEGATFEAVNVAPCAQSHKYEVFAAFNIPSDDSAAFPGMAAISTLADDGCLERFDAFVGFPYEQSSYGIGTMTPTQGSWDEVDDREVMCMISNYDGTLKQGTARDSAR